MTCLLVAGWLLLGQQRPKAAVAIPPPNILICHFPGMVMHPDFGVFDVAIWTSGKIIWRGPPAIWGMCEGIWGDQYFEGNCSPSAVANALTRIYRSGAFKSSGWSHVFEDLSFMTILVRDSHGALSLESSYEPEESDLDPTLAAVRAWKLIRHEARALIPAKGRRVLRPSDRGWW